MLSQALPVFQNLWEYPKLHELGFQVGSFAEEVRMNLSDNSETPTTTASKRPSIISLAVNPSF